MDADPFAGYAHANGIGDPAAPGRLPLLYFGDVQPNLDTADFVEGLLTSTAMSVVYGESNCGKTFFATDLALHVAWGVMWRGREVDQGGVVYCALEGKNGISNRVAAFRLHHRLDGTRLPFAVIPVTINLLDPDADCDRLIAAIAEAASRLKRPISLVVIDTLSRAMAGGNENASEDMGALVASGDRIRQVTGAHICFIHHSGKDAAKGARGHSILRAATDTEIEITREAEDGPSVATVRKQREMECDGEFVFSLKVVQLGENRRGKPVTSCIVEEPQEHDPNGPAPPPLAKRMPRLSGNAQIGLQMLQRAMSKSGGLAPPTADFPQGVVVVPATVWRDEFYMGGYPGEASENKRKYFNRARSDLLKLGVIASFNEFVWLVRSGVQPGQTGTN